MKNLKYLTLAILLTAFVSSCSKNYPHMNGGKTIRSDRNIDSNYTGLSAEGAFDITFVDNQDYSIRITCPENKLQYITTTINNGELYITEQRNNVSSNNSIKVYVNKNVLNRLRNEGSGNIVGELAKTESFYLENHGSGDINVAVSANDLVSVLINGSGDVSLNGDSDDLNIDISGSGNVDAFGLAAIHAYVKIDGSGDAEVKVSESLQVDINGSGDVIYMGDPSLQVSINGSGSVHPY